MGQIYTFYPASDNVQYQRNIGLLKCMQHLSETFKESTEFGICCVILLGLALPNLRFGNKLIHATDKIPTTQPVALSFFLTISICRRCLSSVIY